MEYIKRLVSDMLEWRAAKTETERAIYLMERGKSIGKRSFKEEKLTKDEVRRICAVLVKNVDGPAMRFLNLSKTRLGPGDGRLMADALRENNCLHELCLDDNNIGPESGICFGEALKVNNCLVKLFIASNNLDAKSAKHIGDALKVNNTLLILDLSGNPLRSEGVVYISDGIKVNASVRDLGLANVNFGCEGMKHLADALQVNTTLDSLDVRSNHIDERGGNYVLEALKINTTLENLSIGQISTEVLNCLAQAITVNTSLGFLLIGNKVDGHIFRHLLDRKVLSERAECLKRIFFTKASVLTKVAVECMGHPSTFKTLINWLIEEDLINVNKVPSSHFHQENYDFSGWKCEEMDCLYIRDGKMTALPDDLIVRGVDPNSLEGRDYYYEHPGNLCVENSAIERLPKNLHVANDLMADGCQHLRSLPEKFFVGGNVYLEDCRNIESLPSCILEWEGRHVLYMEGSGVNPTYLRELNPGENLRFSISLQNREELGRLIFQTVEDAVSYWAQYLPNENCSPVDSKSNIPKAYERTFLLFLSKLRGAKEAAILETRCALAKRCIDVCEALRTTDDENIKTEILSRMGDSLDRCHDKPVWALNQMSAIMLTTKARGDRVKLKALGRRLMNLGVVHQHCQRKCESLQLVDDVCVYLKFEIELREALDLPVSALSMHFPSFADVNEADLEMAKQEALSKTEKEFEEWLENWSEWQRQIRLEEADTLRFSKLKKRIAESAWEGNLRNLVGDPIDDKVSLHGYQCSFRDLMKHWIETGCDLHNSRISFQELRDHLKR